MNHVKGKKKGTNREVVSEKKTSGVEKHSRKRKSVCSEVTLAPHRKQLGKVANRKFPSHPVWGGMGRRSGS